MAFAGCLQYHLGLVGHAVPLGAFISRDHHLKSYLHYTSSYQNIHTSASISFPLYKKHEATGQGRGVPSVDLKPDRLYFFGRFLHETTGEDVACAVTTSEKVLREMIENGGCDNVKAHLDSMDVQTLPQELVSIFKMMEKLEKIPQKEIVDEAFRKFIQNLGAFQINGLSRILKSCAAMGYANEDALEDLAQELLLCVNFAQYGAKDISKFIHCLGTVYKTIGGIPTGNTNDDELMVS